MTPPLRIPIKAGAAPARHSATPLVLAAMALAYFGFSIGAYLLHDANEIGVAFWPGAGITVATLLLVRRRDWPLVVAVIFATEVVGDLIQDASLVTSALWAVANCLEATLGALALGWVFRGRRVTLDSTGNALRFLVTAALAGVPVATLVGSLTTVSAFGGPLLPVWQRWYVGDLLGLLVVAPVILYGPAIVRLLRDRLVGELALVAAVSVLVFTDRGIGDAFTERSYLLLPLLVLVSLTRGPAGVAAAAFVTALIANVASMLGHGPFALSPTHPNALVDLQVFTAAALLTVWLFAALATDLRRTRTRLDHLESSFWQLSRDQEVLPICMGCSRVSTADGTWEPLAAFFQSRTDFLSHGYCHDCGTAVLDGDVLAPAESSAPAR
ncbi:MAG TPA: MASE1 domain-containing protein [Gaiellaceae bacterium]|nr:MASE1 domain-containing protein [Gaiellaceae bacterium]